MTISTAPASSAGVLATLAPKPASGPVLSADQFHTVSVGRTPSAAAPMFEPILPMPAMPMCIESLLDCDSDDRRSQCGTKVVPIFWESWVSVRAAFGKAHEWDIGSLRNESGDSEEEDSERNRTRNHGRLVRPQSRRQRLARRRIRHQCKQAQRIGQGRRRDRARCRRRRRRRTLCHHQPAQARGADVHSEDDRRGGPAAADRRRVLDLHHRGQGKGREDVSAPRATSCSIAQSAAPAPRPRPATS